MRDCTAPTPAQRPDVPGGDPPRCLQCSAPSVLGAPFPLMPPLHGACVRHRYDKDKSGKIDKKELKNAMASAEIDNEELAKYIAENDVDGDGKLDLQEFMKLMISTGAYDPD